MNTTITKFLVLVSLLFCGIASAQIDFEDPNLEAKISGELRKTKQSPLLDAVAARKDELALKTLFRFMKGEGVDHAKRGEMFAQIPGAETWVKKKYAELPLWVENYEDRVLFTRALCNIRRRWSLNLLGEMLEETRKVETGMTPVELERFMIADPTGALTNRNLALGAMGRMRLANFPFNYNPMDWDDNDRDAVAAWWKANKHQPDEFFFDGKTDYTQPHVWPHRPKKVPPPQPPLTAVALPELEAPAPSPAPAAEKPNHLPLILILSAVLLSVVLALVKRAKR